MRQNWLAKQQIGEAMAFVYQAEQWARELTRLRTRSPGDTDNAMRAVARTYDVPYAVLWRLRYRRSHIRDIGVAIYVRLERAYKSECERQARKLAHDASVTAAIAGPNHPAVLTAQTLLGKNSGAPASGPDDPS